MISSRAFVFSFLKNYLNARAIAAFPVEGEAEKMSFCECPATRVYMLSSRPPKAAQRDAI